MRKTMFIKLKCCSSTFHLEYKLKLKLKSGYNNVTLTHSYIQKDNSSIHHKKMFYTIVEFATTLSPIKVK